MKRKYILFLSLMFFLALSGCGKEENIVFPFTVSNVEYIESYYDNGESDIQKKTITGESDIDYLYTYFSELPVKNERSSSADDGSTLRFVFNLAEGTSYELTYIGVAVKKGRLQSETAGFDYFTSSDVVGFWGNLSGEIDLISAADMPQ